MEAGEVVYQGREGTGGAQIFNSPHRSLGDYVMQTQRNKAMLGLQQRRLEQQMMNYRNGEIQKWETGNKFDQPSPYYKRPIAKNISDYRQKGRELLNQGYDNNTVRMMTEPERAVVEEQIAKSQKADQVYRDQTAALGALTNKDQQWSRNHLMHKLYAHDEDVDNADFNSAADVVNHPRSTDFSKSVKLATDDIKNQIAQSQINPNIKDSGLGKYMIIDKGRARFGYTDKDGKMVPGISDDLIQHVIDKYGEGSNNELAKSIKWQMAREAVEKQLGHSVDEQLDEPMIMKTYQAMNDPDLDALSKKEIAGELKTRLKTNVVKELNQLQQQSDETVVHGLGQYPRAGDADNSYDYNLVPGDGNDLAPYSEIKEDQVTGFDNPTLPLPNLAKDIVFDKSSGAGDLSGFSTDENGRPVIQWVDDYKQPQPPVAYNKENIAKIRNSIKNNKAGAKTVAAFDAAVNKFDNAIANKAKLTLDGEKLDAATSQIQELYSAKNNEDPQAFRKTLDTILLKHGIQDKSELHRNIGVQWIGVTPKIKIGQGEWLDPASEPEKLKEQLYNLNKKGFSKKATQATQAPAKAKIPGF